MNTTTEEQAWTIKRLLDWTSGFFKSKGLESSRLSAEILLSEALDCQRIELYTRFEEIPAEEVLSKYRDWVKRHAAGEPVAYLVGCREFYSLRFEVDSSVLIPRPETEHVVIAAIDAARSFQKSELNIIDAGTGSGCIAVTLATQLPNARLLATDISPDALKIARGNAVRHNVESRIEFTDGDLFENIPDDFQPDIIVSNPPYIGLQEEDTVETSVRDYEPRVALFAGTDGTEVIERLIEQAATRLPPAGWLIFETSPVICDRCLELVNAADSFSEPSVTKDLAGHRRVIAAQKLA